MPGCRSRRSSQWAKDLGFGAWSLELGAHTGSEVPAAAKNQDPRTFFRSPVKGQWLVAPFLPSHSLIILFIEPAALHREDGAQHVLVADVGRHLLLRDLRVLMQAVQ